MLLAVRTDTPPAVLTADLRTALSDRTVEIGVVGTARVRAEAAALVQRHGPRLALVALAGITVVLAAAFRRVRPAVAILIALGAAVGLMTAILPAIDPVSLPLLILLCGFGCEGSLHLHRISQRGWPSAIMLGSALVPLAFLRYPQWQAWSGWWVLAVLVMVVALRVVAPAFLVLMHSKPPSDRGFRLHPAPRLAVVASAIVLAAGVWAVENLPYQGVDRIDLGEALRPPEQIRLLEQFYDPALVVEVWTPASTDAQALERGAEEARLLTRLVPSAATRIDSPGSMILQPSELERRRRALEDLGLAERLTQLRATLEARGLRPGAFGEFLRGGPNQADLPTADAALTSPLGPWIRGYLIDHPEGRALRTRIYLTPDPDAPLPVVTDADDQPVVLRGPAAAARLDRDRFRNQLGICVAMQLWLGALVVWLATRSLAIALGAALAALVTQMGVLTSMVLLALPLGPLMLPTLLLVGAAAMIAAGRACRAARLQRPFSSAGLWVTSLCPAVAGLALVSSGVPQWEQWGLVTAIGAVLAAGVGLFIAPGLTAVLQSLGGGLGAPTPGEEEASS
jgi:hypothetical protein